MQKRDGPDGVTPGQDYYYSIPACIMLDGELPATAKLLYGLLDSWSRQKGYCWASNATLGQYLNCSRISISRLVTLLADRGYIKVEITNRTQRKLFVLASKKITAINKKVNRVLTKKNGTYNKNDAQNIIDTPKDNHHHNSAEDEEKILDLVEEFGKRIKTPSRYDKAAIDELYHQHGKIAVWEAIQSGAEHDAKSVAYIKKILSNNAKRDDGDGSDEYEPGDSEPKRESFNDIRTKAMDMMRRRWET